MVNLSYWKIITRRKTLPLESENGSRFHRVMGIFDLTTLGVGATLGVGVYVLAGHVARDQAGPSVVVSFAIAALASFFSGLCYAEFGARVPKAGSAYIYSYVCIGEFAAFIIGWNLILEYVIGSASVSRGISLYLDTLINDTLKITFMEATPINWDFMASYFDCFAFGLAFVIGVILAFGIEASRMINSIFTILNIIVVLFVIVAGSFKADLNNWKIDPATVKKPYIVGKGGFFPFGFEGTLKGAATCFFGFVGFDCIATTGEEVKNPRQAIPRSILLSLTIIFLSYFGISTVLTLMWPYYLQDVDAPLPFVFQEINWPVAKWIVTIGGLIGLFSSLFGAMFPLPKIIYAMAQDGLIFRQLGHINPKYKTPIFGNILAIILTALMAALFDLTQLINMLSIGTLLAYTVVSISIIILRFMYNEAYQNELELNEGSSLNGETMKKATFHMTMLQIFNIKRLKKPTPISTRIVGTLLFFYCLCCLGFSLTIMYGRNEIGIFETWALGLLGLFLSFLLIILLAISVQPREHMSTVFRVPFVPFIPCISILVNIYLMLQLDVYTWIRFGIWMAAGLPMYLICTCMYKKTTEVRNLDLFKTQQILPYYDGKIIFRADDGTFIINGNIPKEQTNSIITLEDDVLRKEKPSSKTPSPQQSLDEILPIEQIVNSHKEVKNSNGKIFFIEESYPKELTYLKDEDDAKSVIAILDNVLQVEDSIEYHDFNRKASIDSEMIPSFIKSSTVATVHNSHDNLVEEENENITETIRTNNFNYNETKNKEEILLLEANNETKIEKDILLEASIEQEIKLPGEYLMKTNNEKVSVVEQEVNVEETENEIITPTNKLEDSKIDVEKISQDQEINPNEEVAGIIKQENYESETENESKNSNILHEISLQNLLNDDELIEKNIKDDENLSISRKSSENSNKSHDDKAIHSKSFKEKLSRILGQIPVSTLTLKPIKQTPIENKEIKSSVPQNTKSLALKPSKSETDIVNLFAKNEIENVHQSSKDEKILDNDSNGIPKAPKFDAILYKTVGTRKYNQPKERPKLEVFLKNEATTEFSNSNLSEEVVNKNSESNQIENLSPVTFKKRLENLLQRRLSPKLSSRYHPKNSNLSTELKLSKDNPEKNSNNLVSQDIEENPKSSNSTNISTDQYKDNFSAVLKSINTNKDKANQQKPIKKQPPSTIEEARKILRHVEVN